MHGCGVSVRDYCATVITVRVCLQGVTEPEGCDSV